MYRFFYIFLFFLLVVHPSYAQDEVERRNLTCISSGKTIFKGSLFKKEVDSKIEYLKNFFSDLKCVAIGEDPYKSMQAEDGVKLSPGDSRVGLDSLDMALRVIKGIPAKSNDISPISSGTDSFSEDESRKSELIKKEMLSKIPSNFLLVSQYVGVDYSDILNDWNRIVSVDKSSFENFYPYILSDSSYSLLAIGPIFVKQYPYLCFLLSLSGYTCSNYSPFSYFDNSSPFMHFSNFSKRKLSYDFILSKDGLDRCLFSDSH